jgi:hypothetical protein
MEELMDTPGLSSLLGCGRIPEAPRLGRWTWPVGLRAGGRRRYDLE